MLHFDHLTVIAPTLTEGVEHLRACLDIDVPYGTKHPDMGTHNHRLRLGEDRYLEIIAIDPEAPAPSGPRWFGLDDRETVRADWTAGQRLRAWVARSDDIAADLAGHEALFGGTIPLAKVARFSVLPDGSLPLGGLLPSVIDRADHPLPSARMPDLGATLEDFVLEHPDPARITALYQDIGICGAPRVEHGPTPRYLASIDTPQGRKTLW